jgi:hypothetical protein
MTYALTCSGRRQRLRRPDVRLSIRYWLRRWLTPELELSPEEVARRKQQLAEFQQVLVEQHAAVGALIRAINHGAATESQKHLH